MAWDAVVAGAGPAGSVASRQLAHLGRRVLLVDDVDSGRPKVGESLPGAARSLLRDLGLLRQVEEGPHLTSHGNLSAWGSDEPQTTDFLRDPHGAGWHLDRARFDADLRTAARKAGVVERRGRVRAVHAGDEVWRVELGEESVETRWLLDATGRHAAVARVLGVRRQRDEGLVALFTWGEKTAGDRETRTLVETVPEGWWYTARLPQGRRVVVLHTEGERAAALLRTPGAWGEALRHTRWVKACLAESTFEAEPRATEACGARLDAFFGERWVALGDAALSFDPLSSQGLFNALYTGLRSAEAVHAALDGDRGAVVAYGERLESIRQAYLEHHRLYYSMEFRWPEAGFWARRLGSRVTL